MDPLTFLAHLVKAVVRGLACITRLRSLILPTSLTLACMNYEADGPLYMGVLKNNFLGDSQYRSLCIILEEVGFILLGLVRGGSKLRVWAESGGVEWKENCVSIVLRLVRLLIAIVANSPLWVVRNLFYNIRELFYEPQGYPALQCLHPDLTDDAQRFVSQDNIEYHRDICDILACHADGCGDTWVVLKGVRKKNQRSPWVPPWARELKVQAFSPQTFNLDDLLGPLRHLDRLETESSSEDIASIIPSSIQEEDEGTQVLDEDGEEGEVLSHEEESGGERGGNCMAEVGEGGGEEGPCPRCEPPVDVVVDKVDDCVVPPWIAHKLRLLAEEVKEVAHLLSIIFSRTMNLRFVLQENTNGDENTSGRTPSCH